ncbi:MAG: PilZ domain-containing protein [Spirochaetota bacterium]|jgi:hypothetical protein|nr:PilZ domain-containing protein [Spirochaetota bacterium]
MFGLKTEIPRAPRIGVPEERFAALGIDFDASECALIENRVAIDVRLTAITNISVGGLKVALADVSREPKKDDTIVMRIAGRERSWNIKGRVAWIEPLSAGQWWAGVEFAFSADASCFYRALTE